METVISISSLPSTPPNHAVVWLAGVPGFVLPVPVSNNGLVFGLDRTHSVARLAQGPGSNA